MIKLDKLNKYFNRRKKNEIHVLNNITLSFPNKGFIILHGPSGSGKTTLLNVIGGLDSVQSGVIDFDSTNMTSYNSKVWDHLRNENIGYVFQNYNLLSGLSVFDNIAFALKLIGITDKEIVKKRVDYILKAVNMYPFRKKRAHQLSGGQQQRVAIARALVKNPKVIIADEPTGNLDSKNSIEVMNIIRAISLQKLVIMVTHEKELAKFYGERIIELRDGRIVNDYENAVTQKHEVTVDDTIYLKDLNKVASFAKSKVSLSAYNDQGDEENIDIKLIVKNKTLYLDIDSTYKKVVLLNADSGIEIKDEKYIQKSREQLVETSFRLDELDNKGIKREIGRLYSFKQIANYALRKVVATGAKSKLLLLLFLVGGMLIAIASAAVANGLTLKPEPLMGNSSNHVFVPLIKHNGDRLTYNDILDLKDANDDGFFINPHQVVSIPFMNPHNDENQNRDFFGSARSAASVTGQVDLTDRIDKSDLLIGDVPNSDFEILISKAVAEKIVDSSAAKEIGVWEMRHLLYETFIYDGIKLSISGIVDTQVGLIYLSRPIASFISSSSPNGENIIFKPYEVYGDVDLLAGVMPTNEQVVISKGEFFILQGNNDYSGQWPMTIDGIENEVSGVHDIINGQRIRLMTTNDIEKLLFDTVGTVFVYTNNVDNLITDFKQTHNMRAESVEKQALDSLRDVQRETIGATLGITGFLVGFILLGFFFTIKSSLISRSYEISIHRALGVKRNAILKSFLIEIFILTTITTLVGYIAMTAILINLQGGIIGDLNLFYVSVVSVILGIITLYVLNIVAGIFPIFMLLRRTPAQILSQYDI